MTALPSVELDIDIIDRFQHEYPVKIDEMAAALGLSVMEQNLPSNISGRIEKTVTGAYEITVNQNHSYSRQRFTVAHEIGHYMLHRNLIGHGSDGIEDNAIYRDDRLGDVKERQANRYAASLLMPMDLVKKAWRDGYRSKEALASAFDVSVASAEIRMSELGCRLWAA